MLIYEIIKGKGATDALFISYAIDCVADLNLLERTFQMKALLDTCKRNILEKIAQREARKRHTRFVYGDSHKVEIVEDVLYIHRNKDSENIYTLIKIKYEQGK